VEKKRKKGEGARYDAQRPREHHSNHDADAWSIQMNDEEEPAPSAPGSEIGNDDAASDAEQASSAHKRRKTGLSKCDDEYTVSKRREALSAKARVGVCSCAGHVRQVVSALNLAGWWINHKTKFPILYEVFLLVMAHLMSSAQIERDFSAASLVLPSNRGSMDAKYFQAQLCTLVNFLYMVHPEDMSPKSMSAKEVSEALLAHGFGVSDLYPERVYNDSHDEGYDSA